MSHEIYKWVIVASIALMEIFALANAFLYGRVRFSRWTFERHSSPSGFWLSVGAIVMLIIATAVLAYST